MSENYRVYNDVLSDKIKHANSQVIPPINPSIIPSNINIALNGIKIELLKNIAGIFNKHPSTVAAITGFAVM